MTLRRADIESLDTELLALQRKTEELAGVDRGRTGSTLRAIAVDIRTARNRAQQLRHPDDVKAAP